jgi:hypothetical protein
VALNIVQWRRHAKQTEQASLAVVPHGGDHAFAWNFMEGANNTTEMAASRLTSSDWLHADANALSQASVSERSLGIDVGITWEYGNRTEFTGNLLTWEGRDHIT